MDCRTAFLLVALVSVGGCQLFNNNSVKMPQQPAPEPTPTSVISKAKEGTKRKPQPATLVTLAKVREEQAETTVETEGQVRLRDEARQLYQEAIKVDPKHMPAYSGLTRVYLRLNEPERAIETCTKAIKQDPKNGAGYIELAMCHNARKDWEQAIKALNKALELDPENRQYLQTLGFTQARAGRFDESVATLSKGYGPAHAHFTVARMLRHMNQLDHCKDQLRRALQADPNHQASRDMLTALETPEGTLPAATTAAAAEAAAPQATLDLQPTSEQ